MAGMRSLIRIAPLAAVAALLTVVATGRTATATGPIDLSGVSQIQITIPSAGTIPEIHANCLMRAEQSAPAGTPDNVSLRAMCYEVLKISPGNPAAPPPPPPPYRAAMHRVLTGTVGSSGDVSLAFLACSEVEVDGVLTGLSVDLAGTAAKAGWDAVAGTVTLSLDQDGTPDCDATGSTVVQNSFTPVNLAMNNDADGDGCTDWEELGDQESTGGLRDPFNPYDFFDPDLNLAVAFPDFLKVLQHFSTNDSNKAATPNRNTSPFLPVSDTPAGVYSPRYDRGGQLAGGWPWNEDAPNGAIGFTDFLSLLRQFGHGCAAPPN